MNDKPLRSYQLPVAIQLPVTSYQLPVTSYQLPVTSYQLPATHTATWSLRWTKRPRPVSNQQARFALPAPGLRGMSNEVDMVNAVPVLFFVVWLCLIGYVVFLATRLVNAVEQIARSMAPRVPD